MNKWALNGFEQTYKQFGLKKFNKVYYESNTYEKGRKIITDGLKKGIFYKKKDGAIAVKLKDIGEKILIRANGTTVYVTQDLYLAKLKHNDFKYDKSIYVVASEQNYHFKVLFSLLKLLKYKFAERCYHFSYGMVHLPEGKMKSREGKVVDADDLIQNMINLAKKEITKRHKNTSKKELEKRAKQIALAAIKFHLLKTEPFKDTLFEPKKSISFEGETGPYVQYAHARINSILRKTKKPAKVKYKLLSTPEESKLISLLEQFPEIVQEAIKSYKVNLIANYALNLAQSFSEFYEKHQILKQEKNIKAARLALILAVKQVLKNALNLLAIEAPDKM